MSDNDSRLLIDDPAALAHFAQMWRRIRARRLAAEAEEREVNRGAA